MNILEIGTFDTRGGAAQVSYTQKEALKKLGHDCKMFVHKKYSDDTDVIEIPQTSIERKLSSLFATDINFWNSNSILKSDEYKKAQIVHLHNIHGGFFNIKTLKKIAEEKPVVWTLHDMWAITGHNAWGYDDPTKTHNSLIPKIDINPKLKWNNRSYLFNLKKKVYGEIKINIVPVSHWLERELEHSILKDQKITVIHNGIDVTVFKKTNKSDAREKLGLPLDKKIIMFASNGGKNNPQKGWSYAETVISNFSKDPDILFLCVGGSNYTDSMKNIQYIDYVSNQYDMSLYYSASDIFLFTSLAENFPLMILEAMACGTPVVSFDVGGVKEVLVHKENGYLVAYRDSQDLINGIEYILNLNTLSLSELSQKSIEKIARNFTQEITAKKYIDLYRSIIKTKQ